MAFSQFNARISMTIVTLLSLYIMCSCGNKGDYNVIDSKDISTVEEVHMSEDATSVKIISTLIGRWMNQDNVSFSIEYGDYYKKYMIKSFMRPIIIDEIETTIDEGVYLVAFSINDIKFQLYLNIINENGT